MKELLLFRTFVLFPFIGIAGPDAANALHTTLASIQKEHIIVDVTLALCLMICSAGIWMTEAMKLKVQQKGKQIYSPPQLA